MSEGTRFCWRCDEPITKDRPGVVLTKISISAGGANITLHQKCVRNPAFVRRYQV